MKSRMPNFKLQTSTSRETSRSKLQRVGFGHGHRVWCLALGISLALGGWNLGFSSDWPQWGGRAMRNMYSSEKGLPESFGKIEFKPGTEEVETKGVKNLKWALKIGSQSYGNVTVAGGKVFVGTNNENPRDPRHQGDRSILMCFDEKTGE